MSCPTLTEQVNFINTIVGQYYGYLCLDGKTYDRILSFFMNYLGSKTKLSAFLLSTISERVGYLADCLFCDLFAGTGRVGRVFKSHVRQVIANDVELYSYSLNRHYIQNGQDQYALFDADLFEELNALPGIEGLIYRYYCPGSGSDRNYFTDENGKKIDHIRQHIQAYLETGRITDDQYYFLLCSLLESADKVSNTASVYAAFLKHTKETARQPLILVPAVIEGHGTHQVYCEDANKLIHRIHGDVLYLDPPYNNRQYGNYYHILNTIAEYRPIEIKGVTGMRDYFRSDYCRKKQVASVFDSLIANAQFSHIFLSYNNEGLMSTDTVANIMSAYGDYHVVSYTGYQRFKADKGRRYRASHVTEYLHCLKKK